MSCSNHPENVICDYYSNCIEVERITHTTTGGVAKALKVQFARYGVPDTVVSDNGPQFSSKEFAKFSNSWGFTHVTSSPHYPQSNGKAENAVKTVKRLFKKCHESGQSEHLALNLRNAWRKLSSDKLVTTSRYTALVLAQVNKHTYTLDSPKLPSFLTYIAPVKSTPVTLKGGPSCTLAWGRGGGSGTENGFPTTWRHTTHFFSKLPTTRRAAGIQ